MYSRILILILAVAASPLHPQDSAEELVAAIQSRMNETNTLSADFIQIKHLNVMKHDLVIKGEVALDKKGRMAWRVLSPVRYTCIITGNRLEQWDEDSDQVITLHTDRNPALKMLATSMHGYFSGNFEAMKKEFDIHRGENRTLFLTPRRESIAGQFIRSITFVPAEDFSHIRQVRFVESNSDTTEITFQNVKLNQVLPESKWQAKPR